MERSKLIEKISELKERHLHLRDVILHFLKSLDFRYFFLYLETSKNKLKGLSMSYASTSSIRRKKGTLYCSRDNNLPGSFSAYFDIHIFKGPIFLLSYSSYHFHTHLTFYWQQVCYYQLNTQFLYSFTTCLK